MDKKDPMTERTTTPERIIAALKHMIDKIPDEGILDYAYKHKVVRQGGFQVAEKNVTHFRQKLKSMVRDPMAMDHSLLDMLRGADLYQEFMVVLSRDAIYHGMEPFLAYFGRERFLANLLLDKREDVRELVIEYIGETDWQEKVLPDQLQAVKEIKDVFEQFLDHILPFVCDDQSAYVPEEIEGLRKKTAQLTADRDKLIKGLDIKEKEAGKHKSQAKDLEKRLRKANRDNERLEKSLRTLESEKKALLVKNANLGEAAKERNNELRTLDSSFYRDPLLIKAEEGLQKSISQSKYPPNSLAQSALCLIRTADLIQSFYLLNPDASHRTDEAEEILRGLIEKASAIRKTLGIARGHSPLYRFASGWIEEASSPDYLDSIINFLYLLNELAVLTDDEVSKLYDDYRAKMEQVYLKYTQQTVTDFQELADHPLWHFRKAVSENSPFLLLLDAYNITRVLKSVFSRYYEKGEPLEKVRNHLLKEVARIVEKSDKVEVMVYFDSLHPSIESWSANVKAVYSGKHGKHSADEAIIEDLGYRQNDSTVARCLVTNDDTLMKDAFQLGAANMSVQQFGTLFRVQ